MKEYKYRKRFTFDGKRYAVYGDTLEEVIEKKTNKLRDLKEGKVIIDGSMTVQRWGEMCIDTYKVGIDEDTVDATKGRLKNYVYPYIGALRLKDVTPIHCQKILNESAGMSKSHINKLRQELKYIFTKAQKNHLIFDNPADDLAMPSYTEGERRAITAREREHFLKVAEEHEQFKVFLLMLFCGCRSAEACNCLGSDVYFTEKTPMLHIRGTKTHNSDRHVPIPKYMFDRITAKGDEHIALTETGRIYDKQSFYRTVERLRREMNISMGCKLYRNRLIEPLEVTDEFVPYFFRHTYCTDLQKAGVDIRIAQKLMGHASIEITAKIYTHVDLDEIASAADLMNKYNG